MIYKFFKRRFQHTYYKFSDLPLIKTLCKIQAIIINNQQYIIFTTIFSFYNTPS
jgi:hypothetical protein